MRLSRLFRQERLVSCDLIKERVLSNYADCSQFWGLDGPVVFPGDRSYLG